MAIKIFQLMPDQLKYSAWFVWDGLRYDKIKDAALDAIAFFKDKYGFTPEALWLDKKKKHIWLWHRDMKKFSQVFTDKPRRKFESKPTVESEQKVKQVKRGTPHIRRKSRV